MEASDGEAGDEVERAAVLAEVEHLDRTLARQRVQAAPLVVDCDLEEWVGRVVDGGAQEVDGAVALARAVELRARRVRRAPPADGVAVRELVQAAVGARHEDSAARRRRNLHHVHAVGGHREGGLVDLEADGRRRRRARRRADVQREDEHLDRRREQQQPVGRGVEGAVAPRPRERRGDHDLVEAVVRVRRRVGHAVVPQEEPVVDRHPRVADLGEEPREGVQLELVRRLALQRVRQRREVGGLRDEVRPLVQLGRRRVRRLVQAALLVAARHLRDQPVVQVVLLERVLRRRARQQRRRRVEAAPLHLLGLLGSRHRNCADATRSARRRGGARGGARVRAMRCRAARRLQPELASVSREGAASAGC